MPDYRFVRWFWIGLVTLGLVATSTAAEARQSKQERARRIVKALDAWEAQMSRRLKQLEAKQNGPARHRRGTGGIGAAER